jgi:sarcosine oxidase subunit beta
MSINNTVWEKKYEVIIIGGGLQGLSTTYYLLANGVKDVLLIERSYIGSGSSGRNLGGVRETHDTVEEIALGKEATKTWGKLSKELDFNIFFRRDGYLYIATNEKELNNLKERWCFMNLNGVKAKLLSENEVLEIAPYLNKSIVIGGLLGINDGIAYPFAAIWAFYLAIKNLGGTILQYTNADKLKLENNGTFSVKIKEKTLHSNIIVIAAGPGSIDLALTLGINLPAKILKRQALAIERQPLNIKPMIVVPWGPIAQTIRGEILGGYHDEYECSPTDFTPTRESLEKTIWYMIKTIPTLKTANILRQWAGHYVESPDKKPIIDALDNPEGLYLNVAWRHYGFMMAPVVGKALAKSIISGKIEPILKPFTINRFIYK